MARSSAHDGGSDAALGGRVCELAMRGARKGKAAGGVVNSEVGC